MSFLETRETDYFPKKLVMMIDNAPRLFSDYEKASTRINGSIQNQLINILEDAFKTVNMPEKLQDIAILTFVYEYTPAESANILGINRATAYRHLDKAIEILQGSETFKNELRDGEKGLWTF
ncbi:putative sigma factor [Listeria phage LP-KV022]|uniref:Sigma factor n=4 Tax=Homburgvirus TaxID=1921125 RepID=J9QRV4_9CAUD|nr:sigma factor [Listeria phage P70]YP_008240465.1 putative sigma factor [Listeria phage LP-110]YP_009045078.1 putative sigma factor [Listeria phage LP-114]AWY07683.1 putative sigma factor [Listeria phage LP-KV022]AFQ96235.1 sigma factor [Listeria phage P70]AGI11604.1 putative sigma factor [Listeria phage LP-110]AHL18612.1 putative sigma factor [Listeria phage LP-114]